MAIDVEREKLLTLTEATRVVPRVNGKRPVPSTLWRWCRKGICGVYLEYLRLGRHIVTSTEALQRFFVALAQADGRITRPVFQKPDYLKQNVRTKTQHERSLMEAERILAEAGI